MTSTDLQSNTLEIRVCEIIRIFDVVLSPAIRFIKSCAHVAKRAIAKCLFVAEQIIFGTLENRIGPPTHNQLTSISTKLGTI